MNYSSICVSLILVATSIGGLCAAEKLPKPNIILILADDMGYGDCTVNNPASKISTPNIDQLAEEGLRFTDAHSASVTCTASRYGLLTGINPARTGVRNTLLGQGYPIIDENEITLPSMLRDQGYATHMVGKWHLGFEMKKSGRRPEFDFSKPLRGGPMDRGFDSFFGIHSSPDSSPRILIRGRRPVENPTETEEGLEYVQEEIAPTLCNEVMRLLRDHAASEEEKPLFLYYASPIPHKPHVPIDNFKDKSNAGAYGDYVMQLDNEVGQINNVLKETGLDENTILIFTSDNGASNKVDIPGHQANGIFRGYKAQAWEGGHRMPFFIKWPDRIEAASLSASTINHTDIFATFAELLNVGLETSYPGSAEDSHSFLPALFEPATRYPHPVTVNSLNCIRMDDWKLVDNPQKAGRTAANPSTYELYNLENDPSEQRDISSENPEMTAQLTEQFETFMTNRRLKEGAH
jgi:arylsulfatase A